MGFLADKTVFSPLTKEILEESISFSCGNEDLDGFFHNDAVSYADNLFGKSYSAIILRNPRLISYVPLRSQMPVFSQNTCLMRERKRLESMFLI